VNHKRRSYRSEDCEALSSPNPTLLSLLPLSLASSLPYLRRADELPSAEDVHELEGSAELLVEADERRHFGVGGERLLGQHELYTEERGEGLSQESEDKLIALTD
jgi:hypothetical protein